MQGNVLQSPFPLMNIETSTPGLPGQSGGPMFDADGNIWALQAVTTHTPLGFNPELVDGQGKKHVEHQFINLGTGPSSATIIGLLSARGIKFHQTA